MKSVKSKLWSVCGMLLLLWVASVALGDWDPGDPHKMHFPQEPDPEGWDVCVVCQWIADDFGCTETGPVTDIHFWTSWKGDDVGDIDPTQWDISIWSDAPGQPGVQLWTWNGQGNVTTRRYGTGEQGWVCPSPPALIVRPDHNDYYQVNITNIPQEPEPFTQQEGTVYWLVIRANIPALPSVGWKTSLDSPPNAVWGKAALWSTDLVNWTPVDTGTVGTDPELHDMAFVITGGYVEPDLEYGDAPEGTNAVAYPSTGVTGAFPTCRTVGPATWIQHNNFGGWFGPSFDFELDGNGGWCPACFPPYDQDECFQDGDAGLLFPEPYTIDAALNVVPCPTCNGTGLGAVCQTAVWGQNIDIHVHNFMPNHPPYVPAYVNVLADWDQNGSWGGSSPCPSGPAREHVLVNFQIPPQYSGPLSALMPAGSGFLIGPNPGYVWFRFSITEVPVMLPWDGSGSFEDGETEDYLLRVDLPGKPLIKHSKWSQPPIEIDPTSEIPTYSGWDEPSWFRPEDILVLCPNEVADDFRCLGDMPVTSIHWWGSYLYWMEPGMMPPVLPTHWRIRFWSNVPVNPAGDPNYSHPGQLLWEFHLDANRVEIEEVGRDSYHDFYPEDICYQYHVDLEPDEWFWQGDFEPNTIDNVFWLSIQAVYPGLTDIPYPWGWKTRPWSWMDDAVRREMRIIEPGVMGCVWVPIKDPLYNESFDVAFELDTDPNWIKWEQHYTGIRHWKHYEDELSMAIGVPAEPETKWIQYPDLSPTGMDVDATAIDPCQLLADDFNCVQTGPITDIHIWGSWRDDKLPGPPPGDPTQVVFRLSIHADIPAAQSPTGYSMPGELKWSRRFQPGQFSVEMFMDGVEGYYSPCEPFYDPCNHYIICRYNFYIDRREAFVQEEGNIYWLDVQAEPLQVSPGEPGPRFGWKTSKEHWNDDAVWRTEHMPISRPWEELRYPEQHPYHPNSIDLAFEITTEPEVEPELIRGVADDWRCDSERPVTAAAWWGSYLGYRFKPCHGPFMELPRPPDYFLLSIWTDVPAGVDPCFPFSHPNDIIWHYKAYDYDEVLVGYDKHPHGAAGINVAICGAPSDPNWNSDVQGKLLATGQFNTVDIITVNTFTPTLAQLQAYNAVLVYSDATYADSNALGNVMADYVDAGGGVVCAMFEIAYGSGPYPHPLCQMRGRWLAQGYYVIPRTAAQLSASQATLGIVHSPAHAIMQGVSSFDGGFDGRNGSHRPYLLPPFPTFNRIADWNDTSAQLLTPLVATNTIGGTRRADLGFFPPSSDVRADFWVSSTDGALLMANALTWVAGGPGTQPTPREPVFRYSVRLPEDHWFYQKEPNDIYWFSVVAVYDRTMPNYDWGWTNHKHVFNDDAVAGYLDPTGVTTGWIWEEIFDQTGESADMSFILFTRECLKHTAPEYADWIVWNRPKCWCFPRQCRGDADGVKTGPFWVAIPDLNFLRPCINKPDAMLPPGCICADFDHLRTGPFRVAIPDLNILRLYINKAEALVPLCDQPPIYTGPYNFWTSP